MLYKQMMRIIIITVLATLLCVSEASVRFDNYTLYRLIPKNEDDLGVLKNLENTNVNEYDFWTNPRIVGVPVDILVPPQRKNIINNMIATYRMEFEIVMENIQEQINEEIRINERSRNKELGFNWENYQRIDEIYNWLSSLSEEYSGIVTLIEGGRSEEGRQILGVKVSFRPGNEERGVWIDSLIHAREWITGATSTFILNEILSSTNPIVRQVAESYDWYIFPVINPDGYEYSHTTNRLWRKTRKPYGAVCYGADPNRNWGYRWNTGGASNQPCAETYAGPNEFSEVETETLSKYITSISSSLKIYISLHSYSQLLLLPYGHTTAHLDNYDQVREIGLKAADSLARRYGTQYVVGNVAETIYVATGSSGDWVKGVFQVPVSITYELRDKGNQGFLLSPDQIIPSGEETLDSIITILQESENLI